MISLSYSKTLTVFSCFTVCLLPFLALFTYYLVQQLMAKPLIDRSPSFLLLLSAQHFFFFFFVFLYSASWSASPIQLHPIKRYRVTENFSCRRIDRFGNQIIHMRLHEAGWFAKKRKKKKKSYGYIRIWSFVSSLWPTASRISFCKHNLSNGPF